MSDESFISLGNALLMNKTLKSLHLDKHSELIPNKWKGYSLCTPYGWQLFSKCLTHPNCALEELSLIFSTINDTSATMLFTVLASNTSLKALRMSFLLDDLITTNEWITCFELLKDSKCNLEELEFRETNIDIRGAIVLVDLLSRHMSTVRSLNCSVNLSISDDGWMPHDRGSQHLDGATAPPKLRKVA